MSRTSKYGDLAPENVESLVLYGKALLGSAIAQSAVLGGAAPGAGAGGGEGALRAIPSPRSVADEAACIR